MSPLLVWGRHIGGVLSWGVMTGIQPRRVKRESRITCMLMPFSPLNWEEKTYGSAFGSARTGDEFNDAAIS